MELSAKVETCTGHRLMNYAGKCNHLHGHSYLWTAYVTMPEVQDKYFGMNLDFAVMKRYLKEIVEIFDHGFVVRHDDPLIEFLRQHQQKHCVMNVNPTAENLGSWVARELEVQIPQALGITVHVKETRDSDVRTYPVTGVEMLSVYIPGGPR